MGCVPNSLLWDIMCFTIFIACFHATLKVVRYATPRIGPDEQLFPKNLINDETLLNQYRIKKAEEVMKKTREKPFTILSDIEIRIVASDRGNSYLFQTVAFLMAQQNTIKYNITVCNVETYLFQDLKTLNLPVFTIGTKQNDKRNLNSTLKKENEDYWRCLGLKTRSKYIILVEDDTIIIPQFSQLLKSLILLLDNHESIDYVKLYHPNNLRKLPSLVLAFAIAIIVSYCLCYILKPFSVLKFVITFVMIYYDVSLQGNQFLSELRFYITGSAYISFPESCCTPAVLFRTSSVLEMLEMFQLTSAFIGHAKDHILDESPFTGRQSDVNYVTHIGSFSSVRQRSVFLSDLRDPK